MGIRRISRERALQVLFYADMVCDNVLIISESFCGCFPFQKKAESFFYGLINGVYEQKHSIDEIIEMNSDNWRMKRMSCVDRNILRLAVFEMLYCDDIPLRVSINEAIDIGKRFGAEESGAFINGILDSVHMTIIEGIEFVLE